MWSMFTDGMGNEETLDSNEVRPEMVQDFGAPMEIIGFDVDALYPSLDWESTEEVVREAVLNSDIVWDDVDILEGCRYIALNWSGEQFRRSPLAKSKKNLGPKKNLGLKKFVVKKFCCCSCSSCDMDP